MILRVPCALILLVILAAACTPPADVGEPTVPVLEQAGGNDAASAGSVPQTESQQSTRLPPTSTKAPEKEVESAMSELIVATGTYFGECFGICADVLAVSSKKMHYENFATPVNYDRPENVAEQDTTPVEWANVIRHIDLAAFMDLPDQIGSPDANDMGGEFVEIAEGDLRKRVDFPLGSSVPEIDELLEVLRELRTEFANQYR